MLLSSEVNLLYSSVLGLIIGLGMLNFLSTKLVFRCLGGPIRTLFY